MILPSSNLDFWIWISHSMSFEMMGHKWVFRDICCELKVELGCRNRAVSTNARVMTPYDLRKSTLNYVYFTLLPQFLPYKIAGTGALTPISMIQNQPNIYSLVFPSRIGTLYSKQSNWPSQFTNVLLSPSVHINMFSTKFNRWLQFSQWKDHMAIWMTWGYFPLLFNIDNIAAVDELNKSFLLVSQTDLAKTQKWIMWDKHNWNLQRLTHVSEFVIENFVFGWRWAAPKTISWKGMNQSQIFTSEWMQTIWTAVRNASLKQAYWGYLYNQSSPARLSK